MGNQEKRREKATWFIAAKYRCTDLFPGQNLKKERADYCPSVSSYQADCPYGGDEELYNNALLLQITQ